MIVYYKNVKIGYIQSPTRYNEKFRGVSYNWKSNSPLREVKDFSTEEAAKEYVMNKYSELIVWC